VRNLIWVIVTLLTLALAGGANYHW